MNDGISRLLIVCMVFLGLGGYYLFYEIPKKQGSDKKFMEQGVPAPGELVQKKEESSGGRRNRSTTYTLKIAYKHPKAGRKVVDLEVNVDTYKKIFEGTPFTILYLPDNPEAIAIQGEASVPPWQITISRVFFGIGLLGTAFIGFLFVRDRYLA